jgi:hypothetical protein
MKWIHPARPCCWQCKGIHPARVTLLLALERDTTCTPYCWRWKYRYTLHVKTPTTHVHTPGGGKEYTLHVHTAGGEKEYPVHGHSGGGKEIKRAGPYCWLQVEIATPCTSILMVLVVDVLKGIPSARPNCCWHRHFFRLSTGSVRHRHSGIRASPVPLVTD